MRRNLVLVVFSLFVLYLFADSPAKMPSKINSSGNLKDTIVIMQNDTLFLVVTQSKYYEKSFDWQKHMPWIGAVLVGILTLITNILMSRYSRKSNQVVAEKQIISAKDIALAQIENARKNSQLEFNKTVLSGNRQSWINDLRELISKILSCTSSISVKQVITNDEFENLRFLITKAELMLNSEKDKNFISALLELENCCFDILIRNKDISDIQEYIENVKHHTQKTLKSEWERVKKGE